MNNLETQRQQLLQTDQREFIEKHLGKQEWVTVYSSSYEGMENAGWSSALIPNDQVEKVFRTTNWDLSIGDGEPGCVTYHENGMEETKYFRFGDDDGIEPLVLHRDFYGMRPGYKEISEEFRLFHDLYYDAKNERYLKLDRDGDEEEVIIVEAKAVKIKLKYLRQYLALKQMVLAIYFDLGRYSGATLAELGFEAENDNDCLVTQKDYCYNFFLCTSDWSDNQNQQTFSRLLGKKLILGMDVEKSGKWPYDEVAKDYTDFIIGVDEEGEPMVHNSDPDNLANYFGANPHAPHYLTPVYFKREVLTKYYANPDRYSVEDGFLRCGGLWGLRLDNNHDKYVVTYLGDLGRDLSLKEQLYWKSFNVTPAGGVSDVEWKRGMLAEFADPERADLKFKYRFDSFQKKWQESYGWHLFRPLTEKDLHFYRALHLPVTNDHAEFDHQVLALAKILVDSLNESEIEKALPTKDPEAKGISKFASFLAAHGLEDYTAHVKFLRELYSLRSAGVGHRKGKEFEKISRDFGLNNKDLILVFEEILGRATEVLDYLETKLLS